MQRFWRGFAVMTAMILAGSSTLRAHEECDDTSPTQSVDGGERSKRGPTFPARIGRHDSTLSVSARAIGDQSRHRGDLGQSDEIQHTVTLGTPENRNGAVSLPLPGKGATASFTFDRPGDYEYFCERHQSMRGQIRIQ